LRMAWSPRRLPAPCFGWFQTGDYASFEFPPPSLHHLETAPHRVLRLRSDLLGQSHHLNQDAAYRPAIPREEGVAVKLEGNALAQRGTPHYEAHAALERFWAPYRASGDTPTNTEYGIALKRSLQAAGYSADQARLLVREAIRNRLEFGVLGGEPVPRVPAPTIQRRPKGE
jgi:hypothetical protein